MLGLQVCTFVPSFVLFWGLKSGVQLDQPPTK